MRSLSSVRSTWNGLCMFADTTVCRPTVKATNNCSHPFPSRHTSVMAVRRLLRAEHALSLDRNFMNWAGLISKSGLQHNTNVYLAVNGAQSKHRNAWLLLLLLLLLLRHLKFPDFPCTSSPSRSVCLSYSGERSISALATNETATITTTFPRINVYVFVCDTSNIIYS